jgi:hypothetical protein
MVVALVSAAAAVSIALITISKFSVVSDSAMWSMDVMILAPAVLGAGVSYFIHRTSVSTQGRAWQSQSSLPTAAQEGYFRSALSSEGQNS